MTPLPAILALQDTWIYVCTTNSGNKTTNVEALIDEHLGCQTALRIPNIDPYYSHV